MPVTSLHPAPEFLLDAQGCWYISSNPDAAAHTSILPRPRDDVFLAKSSPFVFEHVSDDLADYALSLPSFDHLLHSSFPAQWTPSRSLLSPRYLPETYTPNRPTLPAQPRASTLTTPYLVGEVLSPWLLGTDPVDRKFPNPFARCPDLEPLFSGRPFSPSTSKASSSAYTHHRSLSPLTPITNLQSLTPHSSPCLSFGSSFNSFSSLTWSSSSSSPSPDYMNSPSIFRYSHPSPVETAAPLLPALHLAGSSKKRLSSIRAPLTPHRATEYCPPSRIDRKRKPESDSGRGFASKRARTISNNDLSSSSSAVPDEPSHAPDELVTGASRRRLFPPGLPINPDFEQIYTRHPVSSFVSAERTGSLSNTAVRADGTFNKPSSLLDLYTPRWVKGVGKTKQGMCPICAEDTSRGGAGTKVWLSMKQSAFNYHMMYKHGISPTGMPFSPPTAFRISTYPAKTVRHRTTMREGRCHKCKKWIALDTVKKDVDVNVKELFWWKHAARCHGSSRIDGEGSFFIEDGVHNRVLALIDSHHNSDS